MKSFLKEIVRALKDHEFFKSLQPDQMMYILIEELINQDQAREEDLEFWMEQKSRWDEVSLEDRLDQIIRVISMEQAQGNPAGQMQNVGFCGFLSPLLFPLKGSMGQKHLLQANRQFRQAGHQSG